MTRGERLAERILRRLFGAGGGTNEQRDAVQAALNAEPQLDPAVVGAVAARAHGALRALVREHGLAGAHELLDDLQALAREAEEAVDRRGRLAPWPFRGRERAMPSWWREEYVNDPLLGALAQIGAPAGRALVEVVAAYWSLRGIMVSAAVRATPPLRIEMPDTDTEVARKAKAAVGAAHPIGGVDGPGYIVPEAEFRALADAMGPPAAKARDGG